VTDFRYRVCGLNVSSELELPELMRASEAEPVDVHVRFGKLGLPEVDTHIWRFSGDEQVVQAPGLGAIAVVGRAEIIVDPEPGVSPDVLAFPLLGPVFALLLHARGHFVLHASAVRLEGAGYGFLGDKGAGKSTTAAALIQHADADLLADDVVAFDGAGDLLPSFAQVKLANDAAAHFAGLKGTRRPPPVPEFQKNQIRLSKDPPSQPVPTRGLFELRRASDINIESMRFEDALKVLLRFSYVSRFSFRELDLTERRRIFQQATDLAGAGVVKRLYVPDSLESLVSVVDTLRGLAK
jgi:hypothetical protein